MNEVPETGSIPVSPMTLTAIAPSKKVVASRTIAKIIAGNRGNPPKANIAIIATNAIPMNIGMCSRGHSYHPLPSMNSSPFSPVKALAMSPNMLTNVGAIFRSP